MIFSRDYGAQCRLADDVGGQDGGKVAFHAQSPSGGSLAANGEGIYACWR
jgi:hypothetical protein